MLNVLIKPLAIILVILASNAVASEKILWNKGPNQSISIRTADLDNISHPVNVNGQTLKSLLTHLHTLNEASSETKAVFNEKQVTLLAKYAAQGLAQLTNNQAIYFSVYKDNSTMGGLIKSEVFTAGAIFNTNEGLTIAIGDHNRERDYSYEAMLDLNNQGSAKYDFNYGLSTSEPSKVALLLDHETTSKGAFIANENKLTVPNNMLASLVLPNNQGNASNGFSEAPDTLSRDEVQKMIEEKSNLSKQQIQEIVREAKTEPTEKKRATPSTSIEARFEMLENLKAKGLITEQEYQQKRQELLSEI